MRTLETKRLVLKKYEIDDAEDVYQYSKNPNVGPIAGWKPHESVNESRKIIKELFFPSEAWAIRLKGGNKVIGTIALEEDRLRPEANSKEIGYSLAEDEWGKGLMTEAVAEVIRFAFEELDLDQLGISTSRINLRSQRVIEKSGFKYEGTIRRTYKVYDGTLRDSMVFSILKTEWIKSK